MHCAVDCSSQGLPKGTKTITAAVMTVAHSAHAMLWACLPHTERASVSHKRPTCQHQRPPSPGQIPLNLSLWHEHWRGWVEVPAEHPVAECHSMMTAGP